MKSLDRWVLGGCFFVSGATSLILQVAWSKELSYILGNTLYAVATVVAAFMAGLGIGSALAGRFAEHIKEPVCAYAIAQFCIAVCGASSIPIFRATEPVFRFLFQTLEPYPTAFLLTRFGVTFILMLVPVTLMGMTLPIVLGAYARRKKEYGFEAGMMYGINTLGAVAGTWLAGLFMLPFFGLWMTCVIVGVIDVIVGLAALWVNGRVGEIQDIRKAGVQPRQIWTRNQWVIGSLFAASGAAAMVYEVGWFRLLALTVGGSVYAFSVILGMFLLGVGFGSTVAARWAERTRMSGVSAMAALEILLGLVTIAGAFYYNQLPQLNHRVFLTGTDIFGMNGFVLGQMVVAAVVVLPPCVIMGALFPVTVRAVRESGGDITSPEANIGRLYVMNTFGGIAGSLVAGFLMGPRIGVWSMLLAASVASAGLAFMLLMLMPGYNWKARIASAFGLVAVVGLAMATPSWDAALFNQGLYRDVYKTRMLDLQRVRKDQLLYYAEGINSPVAVFNVGGAATLRVGGKADASTITFDVNTQLFVGHLPVMFAENPRRAAVIGYGSGMSAMAMLTHPEIESLDVIEIEQAVIDASPYFDFITSSPLLDRRANLILDDARIHLTHSAATYDVITSEPSNPWMAGVSNLFTADFYRIVRERLTPGGVFGQWIQTYEMSEETFKVILASIHDAFPHVVVFRPAAGDVLVLASGRPIQVPWKTFQKRFLERRASASFERVNILDPLNVFFHFYASEKAVRDFTEAVTLRNTDDNVWLEYRMPRNMLQEQGSIGMSLLRTGNGEHLQAFETMLPGVPLESLIRESLAYQYRMELSVDPSGIVDRWAAERTLAVERLRSEIVRRNDLELLMSFEKWITDGEAKIRSQVTALHNLIRIGDAAGHVAAIQNIVDMTPDLARAHIAMANAQYRLGDLQIAESYYRNALAYVSSDAYHDALIGLGNIAATRGELQQAQDFYERAIAQNPYRVIGFRALALLLRGNDAVKLRKVVERGLVFNPGDPELQTMLPTSS
jgi:spermidine synthase